jgi:molecular chaperone DnaJ
MGFDTGFGFGFDDIFERFFGHRMGFNRRGGRPRRQRGADLRYDIEISLENAYSGLETMIRIPRSETCENCNGSGAKPGTKPISCPRCGGSGQIRASQRTAFGMFTQVTTCNKCGGQGTYIEERCPECRGRGIIQKTRSIELKIPKGVDDGSQLRLAGEGEADTGGSGDLYIVIHIQRHPSYKRRGMDLFKTENILFTEAALGTKIQVKTMSGTYESLKVPEGTQNQEIFKIKGAGMPGLHGRGKGDLYVEINLETPKKLSRKAKKLLEELNNTLKNN